MSGNVWPGFGWMPMAWHAVLSTAAAPPASNTSLGKPTSRAMARHFSFREGMLAETRRVVMNHHIVYGTSRYKIHNNSTAESRRRVAVAVGSSEAPR